MESLIDHIAKRHISSRENLATEILVYVLERADSSALHSLLTESGVHLDPGLCLSLKRDRKGKTGRWRPDIQVLDEKGNCRALIENKFDARLTKDQLESYLSELMSDDGRLVFVVPEKRKEEVQQLFRNTMGRGRVTVIPWRDFLGALKKALELPKPPSPLLSDFVQLRRYCDVMEEQTFDPFDLEQIRDEVLSQPLHQLTWITADFIRECRKEKIVHALDKKDGLLANLEEDDSLSCGQDLAFCGALVWMGLWVRMWRKYRSTPLWICLCDSDDAGTKVGPKARSRAREIKELLAQAKISHEWEPDEKGWIIPVPVKALPQGELVQQAVDFVKHLHELVRRRSALTAKRGSR